MSELILSLTTIPSRWDYLQRSLESIFKQTFFGKVSKLYINVDDDISDEMLEKYHSLESEDSKILIQVCDKKWKSANKLVWTYKKHHDDVIVCFDDDKSYPPKCLEQLYTTWLGNKDCIIAQEINPAVFFSTDSIGYVNGMDVKLMQREWGKYLSNACLFPPNCFTDELWNYEHFKYVTQGNHDELWFWIVSTLKGVQCIGLNNTYSYALDKGVTFEFDDGALSHINGNPDTIAGYNARLNELFGPQLIAAMNEAPVKFSITKDNILAFCGILPVIYKFYGPFRLELDCDETIVDSWLNYLKISLRNYKWRELRVIIAQPDKTK